MHPYEPGSATIESIVGSLVANALTKTIELTVVHLGKRQRDAEVQAEAQEELRKAQRLRVEPLAGKVAAHMGKALSAVAGPEGEPLHKATVSFLVDPATQHELSKLFVTSYEPGEMLPHDRSVLTETLLNHMEEAYAGGEEAAQAEQVVDTFMEAFWQAVSEDAKLSFLSHHRAQIAVLDKLDTLIKELRDARAATPPRPGFEEEMRRYIDFVKSRAERLDFIGMPIIRPDIEAPRVDQIYVSLKAVRQRAMERLEPEEMEERLAQAERLPKRMLRREETERPVEIGEAMRRHRRLVILGKPGSGKSTMMKYIALAFAENAAEDRLGLEAEGVPILIELRDFAAELPEKGTMPAPLTEFLAKQAQANDCDVSHESLRHMLKHRDCIVLLDGLDEVRDDADRARVAESVKNLLRACGEKTRVIVTSRITGYRADFFTGGQFEEFVLQDFTIDREIPEFVNKWYSVVETIASDRSAWAATPEGLIDSIRTTPGIERLACNPLMLTLIALIHRTQGGQLPQRRIKLYDICAKTLLESWDVRKGLKPVVDEDEARRRLESLALWMHQRPSRDRASYEEVVGQIAGRLVERGKFTDLDEAKSEAKRFLSDMRDRAGLLVERGIDVWGFMHFTFQEYCAACAMHKIGSIEFQKTVDEVMEHVGEPAWEETIRLLCGLCTEEQVEAAVGKILDQEDDIFYSNLFLAARCLGDAVTGETRLTTQVEDALLGLCRGPGFSSVRDQAVGAMAVGRRPSTVRGFIQALKGGPSGVRRTAAWALGCVGAPEGVQPLIGALKSNDSGVRRTAAWALGSIGAPEGVQHLIGALKDNDSGVRGIAAWALGNIGSPEAVQHLIQAFEDKVWQVRGHAAEALGGLRAPDAIQPLVQALKDEVRQVRGHAAAALGSIRTPDAIGPLVEALNDEDSDVRWRAGWALGSIRTPGVVQRLIQALQDGHSNVRWRSAQALGSIRAPEAIGHLIKVLKDEHSRVRERAAEALGHIGAPEAVQSLIQALQDADSNVRWRAAWALGRVGAPDAARDLIQALRDEVWDVRRRAAQALGRIGTPETVRHVIQALKDENWSVRWRAAQALGNIGAPEAVRPVIAALKDRHSYVRLSAASALGNIGAPDGVQHLIGALKDEDSSVRDKAHGALKRICDRTGMRIYPRDVPGWPRPWEASGQLSVVSSQKKRPKGKDEKSPVVSRQRKAGARAKKTPVVSSQKKRAAVKKGKKG